MKRRRAERHQPVMSEQKVWKLGSLKTYRNSCSNTTKLSVSSMNGLLVVRVPDAVFPTVRITPNNKEADFIHDASISGKSAKLELSLSSSFAENLWIPRPS